jgi:3-phosphoshikimate 1-carboxyvinyltransferase
MLITYTPMQAKATIQLPSSKSMSNRLLLIQALSKKPFTIHNVSKSSDTIYLQKALESCKEQKDLQTINIGDAGTPFRFLTAFLATQIGKTFHLCGSERLHQRPIAPLVNALRSLGAIIEYTEQEGFPPLQIIGTSLHSVSLEIDASISSQFISALCLIAPCLPDGLHLKLNSTVVSSPYIYLSLQLMQQAGIELKYEQNKISIPSSTYHMDSYVVESDWSAACFFYCMLMIEPRLTMILQNVQAQSIQGDTFIQKLAQDFGIESLFENGNVQLVSTTINNKHHSKHYNLTDYPDLAIPFIVACALSYPHVTISGIAHLEWKESKRITALQTELQKVGRVLHYENELLRFEVYTVPSIDNTIIFSSYDDHRIVMALSMVSFLGYTIRFNSTNCIHKSFPDFFKECEKLGVKVENALHG